MSAIALSGIAFACALSGALVGMFLRRLLPGHHLSQDAKDVVRLGSGLIATMAALVLGLLIASAKSSYDTQSSQVRQLTAYIVLIDQLLAQYGPDTLPARELMRGQLGPMADGIWGRDKGGSQNPSPFAFSAAGQAIYASLQKLTPATESQRALQARALQMYTELGHIRLLLFERASSSIPMPFLAVLLFWLAILFASFSLFADPNAIVIGALCLFALSVAGAIFLILELDQPFAGLMQISSIPMRNALAPIGP